MLTNRTLIVEDHKAGVISRVARDARRLLVEVLTKQDAAHVALTGGSVGIGILDYLGATDVEVPAEERVDWSRVHLWWGDERFVPAGHEDRNDAQAESVFIRALPFSADHIHRMPASDAGLSIVEAAKTYATEIDRVLPRGKQRCDLVFLGVGSDAHVASLFPGQSAGSDLFSSVISVTDSPKPPSARLSLTLSAINSSAHVWLVTAGSDKEKAVRLALGPSNFSSAPASAVSARIETRVYCDHSAHPEDNTPRQD